MYVCMYVCMIFSSLPVEPFSISVGQCNRCERSSIHRQCDVTKQLAALSGMEGWVMGVQLYGKVIWTIEEMNLMLDKLHGITTDGAMSFAGKKNRFTTLST